LYVHLVAISRDIFSARHKITPNFFPRLDDKRRCDVLRHDQLHIVLKSSVRSSERKTSRRFNYL